MRSRIRVESFPLTEDREPGINKKVYIEILEESFPGFSVG